MGDFLVFTAFYDKGNRFRRRNILAVLDNFYKNFPECDICVAEQNPTADTLFNDELISKFGGRLKYIPVTVPGSDFRKPVLLNAAVRGNPGYRYYVMGDADAYLDQTAIDSIRVYDGTASIRLPFNDVMYLNEGDTRRLVAGLDLLPGKKDHGVQINRQTGLTNVFTQEHFDRINGFDESFTQWGAEDDAFLTKMKRLVGPSDRVSGTVYHLFHQRVDTQKYRESQAYLDNRKRCACIRRITMDELERYVRREVSLAELVRKYEAMNRLNVRLRWSCTPGFYLTIDTTLYDIDYSGEMSFTKILEAVKAEDGADYIPTFVKDIFTPITDLSDQQKREIQDFVDSCSSQRT